MRFIKKKTAKSREVNSFAVLAVFVVLAGLATQASLENQPESELNQPGFVPLLPYSSESASHCGLINSELNAVEDIEKLRLELECERFLDFSVFAHGEIKIVDAMRTQLRIGTSFAAKAV
jgi:hypothetical protein